MNFHKKSYSFFVAELSMLYINVVLEIKYWKFGESEKGKFNQVQQ